MVPPSAEPSRPSTHPSRRTVLAGVGACIATALAGCSASDSAEHPPDEGTLVTDYTAAMARAPGEQLPIVSLRRDGAEADESSTSEPFVLHAIESEDAASTLELADDAANAAAVRRLVAETDYGSESVLVYQTSIGECYRLKVNYVTRDDDGTPNVDLCRVVRDADVACERDARDHVAVFVRLPFPGDEYGGLSAGGGGSCDPVPDEYRTEGESS